MAMAKEIPADVDTDPIHRQTETAAIVIKWPLHVRSQSFSSEKTQEEQHPSEGVASNQEIQIDSNSK
jgi:hypothetical protein